MDIKLEERICKVCKEKYKTLKESKQVFCSQKCRQIHEIYDKHKKKNNCEED